MVTARLRQFVWILYWSFFFGTSCHIFNFFLSISRLPLFFLCMIIWSTYGNDCHSFTGFQHTYICKAWKGRHVLKCETVLVSNTFLNSPSWQLKCHDAPHCYRQTVGDVCVSPGGRLFQPWVISSQMKQKQGEKNLALFHTFDLLSVDVLNVSLERVGCVSSRWWRMNTFWSLFLASRRLHWSSLYREIYHLIDHIR